MTKCGTTMAAFVPHPQHKHTYTYRHTHRRTYLVPQFGQHCPDVWHPTATPHQCHNTGAQRTQCQWFCCCHDQVSNMAANLLHIQKRHTIFVDTPLHVSVCGYVRTHVCIATHTYITTIINRLSTTHKHTYVHSHTHTYANSHTHTHTHTYVHTLTHTYVHAHTHTHTYVHAHTHTRMCTHSHTRMCMHAHNIYSNLLSGMTR